MKKRLRLSLQITVIGIVMLAAVLVAGIAVAQSSTNFNLACWGVMTGGGGDRGSTSYRLTDAFGQTAGTENGAIAIVSPNFQLRPGYAQNFSYLSTLPGTSVAATSIQAPAVMTTDVITVGFYIPLLNTYMPTIFNCPT